MYFLKKLIDAPLDSLDQVLLALDYDAQANTCLSQEALSSAPLIESPSDELKNRIDAFCDDLRLPKLDWAQNNRPIEKSDSSHNGQCCSSIGDQIRRELDLWQPDDEGFFFQKFGRRTILMWKNSCTGHVEPFSVNVIL